jgi:hypothetical protein
MSNKNSHSRVRKPVLNHHFSHSGSVITEGNDYFEDVRARVRSGWACLSKLKTVLLSRKVSLAAKLVVYRSIIRPVVL